jgi:hypothetical protein
MNGILNPMPQGILSDPRQAAMLQAGLGLLQASGPSRTPVGLGQAIGQAGMQGLNAFHQTNQANQQNQMFQMKLAEVAREAEERKKKEASMAALRADPRLAGMGALLDVAPAAAIERAFPKPTELKPQLVDVADPSNPTRTIKKWILPGQTDGTVVGQGKAPEILDPAVQAARRDVAAAGAPKVDVKLGEGLAGNVKEIVSESRNAAVGSIGAIDTAGRIEKALAAGNVNLGPTATIRNKADQFAQVLGVGGRDTEERLVNTRNVIRGLAQFTITARKALKGQGQVSDYEGKLLTKAESGDIEDFTAPELKDFIATTKRIAKQAHKEHKRIVGVMAKDPNIAQLVPYYDIPDLPGIDPKAAEDWVSRAMKRNMVSRKTAIEEGVRLGKVPEDFK